MNEEQINFWQTSKDNSYFLEQGIDYIVELA